MSMIVYAMKANVPPDSDGKNQLPNADIRYAVVDEWGELDIVIQSVNGLNAVLGKGAGKGAKSQVNDGLRDRVKALALNHYFSNYAKEEFEF
jgi:hypothetical protein